jgi:3-oxoacyl-[acyl-carrier protein] reductase
VIVSRSEDRLRRAAAALGPNAAWLRADVSRRDDVQSAIDDIVRRHGRIDVLVNNAGAGRKFATDTPLYDAEQMWDEMHAVDLKGPFLMAMAAAPHLTRPGGRIINISSIAAQSGSSSPGSIAYAAAKAGVIGLTFALARELSPQGITVNAVAPGYIAGTGFFGGHGLPEAAERSIAAQTAVGRVGRPEDVAEAVRYLASPAAGFITGEVMNVNGGQLFGR